MSNFNQVPPQCQDFCPLEQGYVDKHGIVLSLNCKGVAPARETLESRIRVDTGSVVAFEKGPIDAKSNLGRSACRNTGLNLWLDQRVEEFTNEIA